MTLPGTARRSKRRLKKAAPLLMVLGLVAAVIGGSVVGWRR